MKQTRIRLLALFLALLMPLSLAACGGGKNAADATAVTETPSGSDHLPAQSDPGSSGSDPEGKTPVKGPKMLRCVEYYVGGDSDVLSSYTEYTYDEQGNCAECEEYKLENGEWVHFRHNEFTYDSQGRVQEKRSHTFSEIEDVDDTLPQIESAPDHVALSLGTGGSQLVFYYNDLGQCIKEEFNNGYGQIYNLKTYEYDDEGKITEANLYYPSAEKEGEYTLYSYFVYEYEGDAVSLLDVIHPAEPQPAETQPSQGSGASAMLAGYVGTFTPYEAFSGSYGGGSKFQDVMLDAQGVVTGGGTDWLSISCHGQEPSSITQNQDGSIVLTYSAYERYTIYPAGVIPEMYAGYLGNELDRSAVHLEYFLTDGGIMNILYHADPASLGNRAALTAKVLSGELDFISDLAPGLL